MVCLTCGANDESWPTQIIVVECWRMEIKGVGIFDDGIFIQVEFSITRVIGSSAIQRSEGCR